MSGNSWLSARLLLCAAIVASAHPAHAQRFATTRVNLAADGAQAAGPIDPPGTAAISGDGRWVAFDTGATNLLAAPGDVNGTLDVYLKDRTTSEVIRVSRGLGGAEPNGRSFGPAISRDGRWVAFYSNASNLVADDTNGLVDAFVFDRLTGQTTRVSVSTSGEQKTVASPSAENNFIVPGMAVVLSATGRFVVFESRAANLTPFDTNDFIDVFVRDRDTDQDGVFDDPATVRTTRVSLSTAGAQGNANSYATAITPDGRHVLFLSFANTLVAGDSNTHPTQPGLSLEDVFVRDRDTDADGILDEAGAIATVRVNVSTAGAQTIAGSSSAGGISDNGRFVVFGSSSAELLDGGGDTNGKEDVFVRDRDTDGDTILDEPGAVATVRVSVSTAGIQADAAVNHGDGYFASAISADGRFVSFTSESSNLVAGDTNGQADIFLRDRDVDNDGVFDESSAVSTSLVSVASDANQQLQTGSYSSRSAISSEGRVVVFWSSAANLVPGDTNNLTDLFAFDRAAWSLSSLLEGGSSVIDYDVSSDGRWVLYESAGHVFVRDRTMPDGDPAATVQMDVSVLGAPAIGSSTEPEISEDGRFVVFTSTAANLMPGDTNGVADVFVRDRDLDQDGVYDEPGQVRIFRANVATGGAQAMGGPSGAPSLSPNGLWIAFTSTATNLTPGASAFRQVYLHNRVTRSTTCLSERHGSKGDGDSTAPAVANNAVVAFETAAANLDWDTNGQPDVYVSIPGDQIGAPGPHLYALSRYRDGADEMRTASGSEPSISADGHWVAYTSRADLESTTAGTIHPFTNVYLQIVHTLSWSPIRVSRPTIGGLGNGHSRRPAVATVPGASDRYQVIYVSSASNLVPGDTNGVDDIFRTELSAVYAADPTHPFATGWSAEVSQTTRVSVNPDGSQRTTPSETAYVPPSGAITIMKATGSGTDSAREVRAVVERIDPAQGPSSGGTRVTIYGRGLGDVRVVPHLYRLGVEVPFGQIVSRSDEFIVAETTAVPMAGSYAVSLTQIDLSKSVTGGVTFTFGAGACSVAAVVADAQPLPAAGGPLRIDVADPAACGWAVTSDAGWLTAASPAGTGNATATLTVGPNADNAQRTARVRVGEVDLLIAQAGAPCAPVLTSRQIDVGAGAFAGTVTLVAGETCAWQAQVDDESWLHITSAPGGTGSTVVSYLVDPTDLTVPRSGDLIIGGQRFTVNQAAATAFTLTVLPPFGGRVVGGTIDCGPACTAAAVQGTSITLTALPNAGRAFDRWTGACEGAGTGPCTLVMNADRVAGATFRQALAQRRTLTITLHGTGTGSVTGPDFVCPTTCQRDYPDGTVVTMTRTSGAGSAAGVWGSGCSDTVQMTQNRTCSLTFDAVQSTATLTVQLAGEGTGTVTSVPAGIVCGAGGAACSHPFAPGTMVSLVATAAPGSSVGAWEPISCGTGPFSLTQSRTCTARFDMTGAPRTLTVTRSGRGRILSVPEGISCAADCTEVFPDGSVVRLAAVPEAGATLSAWGGACSGRQTCSIRLTSDAAVTATFEDAAGASLFATELRPTSGPAAGGSKVRIYGSGFAQGGAASVTIGGRPALGVEVLSDTVLLAVTPALPTPPQTVPAAVAHDVVINVGGATATLANAFRAVLLDGSPATDSDGDGMPDQWESTMGLDLLVADATADTDGDGVSNADERLAGTHPVGFYTRYLAEGATGTFFDTRIGMANATSVPATTLITFQSGAPHAPHTVFTVPGESRRLVHPRLFATLESAEFGAIVESDVELAVDRQMFWPQSRYGSHAGTSVASPRTVWYLAEGATGGPFDLFYLLQNPNLANAEVRIRFLLPAGAPIERTYTVLGRRRLTVYVDQIPGLGATDVSAVIESINGVPIMVERAMYVSHQGRPFDGGHNSAAVEAPATSWFLAEGATGSFFDTFILLANPNPDPAVVQARYLLPDGSVVVRAYQVEGNSRRTIWVDVDHPRLSDTSVSTVVTSLNNVPIIAERAMWWPGADHVRAFPGEFPVAWTEAHHSPGSTVTATKWAVADGETGPFPMSTVTYLLVANTSPFAATIRVKLLSERDFPPLQRQLRIPANSRLTVDVGTLFPETRTAYAGYGAVVESLPDPEAAQIVVERAMYNNTPDGRFWAAGSNILATPVR